MKKSVNKNKQKWQRLLTKRNMTIAAIALVVLLPVGLYGYNKWLDWQDYQKFMSLKEDLKIAEASLSGVKSGIKWSPTEGCQRGNVTFGDGLAVCGVGLSASVYLESAKGARSYIDAYNDTIDTKTADIYTPVNETRGYPDSDIDPSNLGQNNNGRYGSARYTNKKTGVICVMGYSLAAADTHLILQISFSCGDYARDTWFARNDVQE